MLHYEHRGAKFLLRCAPLFVVVQVRCVDVLGAAPSAQWCAADVGPLSSVMVLDQRRTVSLRFTLHRVRDTINPIPFARNLR